MLRTVVVRNELLRETIKKAVRINSARALSVECTRRRHRTNQPSFLKYTNKLQWKDNAIRFYADYPSHIKINLPALSPTMEVGTIVSWAKKEGDKLNEGDLLAEIETDKATMGFETPEEGYLAKILIPGGTKGVPIGKLVCIIVANQADVAAFKNYVDDSAPTPAQAAPKPAAAAPTPAAAAPTPAAAPPTPGPPPPAAAPGARVYASPMARKLAEQREIRLQGSGTGMYDSITSRDLPAAGAAMPAGAPRAGSPPPRPSAPGAAFTDIPLTSMRTTIAKRLLQSKQTIPHYYLTMEVNLDKIMKLRAKLNKANEKKGLKLSLNDFIIKALAIASMQVPAANSMWMDTVVRQFRNVDVSIAVATDAGLITPIVFNAQAKGLITINKEVKQLALKARSGRLKPHEFQGGTITLSNLGMYDMTAFCAVINPPQACILAVGSGIKKLVLDEKSEKGFKEVTVMNATLSCDHRVIDGAVGAQWLQAFRRNLEDPDFMHL